jgi:transcriptional regulator with XRE-family HTH domain
VVVWVAARGGATALARELGVNRSTVYRWRSGECAPGTRNRDKLEGINRDVTHGERHAAAQREWGELANRYGGTKGLAQQVDVSTSTVNKWLNGTSSPNAHNLASLQRADRTWRIKETYHLTLGDNGRPDRRRVYFRVQGDSKIKGAGSPEDERHGKNWGSQNGSLPGLEFTNDDALNSFWDNAVDGDEEGTLDALQSYMSTDVTSVGTYSPDEGLGVFFDRIDDFLFIQEDD